MNRMIRAGLGIIIIALGICAFILMPVRVEALPLDPFGDSSVLMDIAFAPVGDPVDDDWLFTYSVENTNRDILYITVGTVNPEDTEEHYAVLDYEILDPVPDTLEVVSLGSNSLLLYFLPPPGLAAPGSIAFTMTYDDFPSVQSVGFREGSGSLFEDVLVKYEKPADDIVPIPEPATLFILGSGIVALGLLYRKKRK